MNIFFYVLYIRLTCHQSLYIYSLININFSHIFFLCVIPCILVPFQNIQEIQKGMQAINCSFCFTEKQITLIALRSVLQKTDKNRNELSAFKEEDFHRQEVYENTILAMIDFTRLHVNSSISRTLSLSTVFETRG